MPRRHRYLADMMVELEATTQPPFANYIFLNAYFFLEAKPDANVSTDFIIARLRHRASKQMNELESLGQCVLPPRDVCCGCLSWAGDVMTS